MHYSQDGIDMPRADYTIFPVPGQLLIVKVQPSKAANKEKQIQSVLCWMGRH